MSDSVEAFYDDLAESYHLIFENWDRSIASQAAIIGPIVEHYTGKVSAYVLDCACGIGTQTIGLAQRGHILVGSDLSKSAVARARTETQVRGIEVTFHVADMRKLSIIPETGFDAVLIADNALPHLLSQPDLEHAAVELAAKLKDSGILLATLRDYDHLLSTRPTMQEPAFYEQDGKSRFVHQVWQWHGEQYAIHVYLTLETESGWSVKHFVSMYRALRRSDLNQALQAAGFTNIRWLEPGDTSFYQPIVIATNSGPKIAAADARQLSGHGG
jgi:ubiquinone/menaquinone biosynthesis C-methylase UbiE